MNFRRKLLKSYKQFETIALNSQEKVDKFINNDTFYEQKFEFIDLPRNFPEEKKIIYEIVQDGFAKFITRPNLNLLAIHMDMHPRELTNRLFAMRFTLLQAKKLHYYLSLQLEYYVNIYKDRTRTVGEKTYRNPKKGAN